MKQCKYCGREGKYKVGNDTYCCSSNQAKCPTIKKRISEGLQKSWKNGKKFNKTIECSFCKKKISLQNISLHEKTCKFNPQYANLCPICGKPSNNGCVTCSKECRYIHFGGPNRGKKQLEEISDYRIICFYFHEKRCIICGEKRVVVVHHYDRDRNNNKKENLIPLCPTHHDYIHYGYGYLLIDKVHQFIINQY